MHYFEIGGIAKPIFNNKYCTCSNFQFFIDFGFRNGLNDVVDSIVLNFDLNGFVHLIDKLLNDFVQISFCLQIDCFSKPRTHRQCQHCLEIATDLER